MYDTLRHQCIAEAYGAGDVRVGLLTGQYPNAPADPEISAAMLIGLREFLAPKMPQKRRVGLNATMWGTYGNLS